MPSFTDMLREKVLVFDGATGTHLQGQHLTADDFGGEHLNGCNEILVVSKPSAVQNVHRDYLEAGCRYHRDGQLRLVVHRAGGVRHRPPRV